MLREIDGMFAVLTQFQFKHSGLTSLGALGLVNMNYKFSMYILHYYYHIDYQKVQEIDSEDSSKCGEQTVCFNLVQ